MLGFDSFERLYMADVIAELNTKDIRAQVVWTLYDDGYSQRGIAQKLGVTDTTVKRDLKKRWQVQHNVAPASKGRDGKTYKRRLAAVPDPVDDQRDSSS